MLNCAESRCTTWAIAARSAREAGITYQRDRWTIRHPVTPHNPKNTRPSMLATIPITG